METVTNAASNVASVASRAIWGDNANEETKTNETGGKEPVSGEVGDVKSGEPYDKGNSGEPAPEPKFLTKTASKEIPSSDSTTEIPSTSKSTDPFVSQKVEPTEALATTKIEPLEDQKIVPAPTETLETTKIEPLEDTTAKSGGAAKVEEGVKKIGLSEGKAETSGSKVEQGKGKLEEIKEGAKEHKLSLKEKIKAKLHKGDKK